MCRYNATNCAQYVGKTVAVHTQKGIHRGRIDRVGSRGVYLTPIVGPRNVAGDTNHDFMTLEQHLSSTNAEHVYWGYGRRWGYGYGGWGWGAGFWIPFLSILALSPLFFW